MIASLGMYDRPETAAANDRFWSLIRDEMRARGLPAPDALTRGEGAYWPAWKSQNLVFSQTCGFPYRTSLYDQVTLVGTPDYGMAECPPGYYQSVFVARKNDPRREIVDFATAAFAFNEGLSQSGWAAPQNHAATLGFQFLPTLQSGGHLRSATAVAEGRADIAAIDAVTWAMLLRWEPFTQTLQEVGRTAPTPGLPFIAGAGTDGQLMFDVVEMAIDSLGKSDRNRLQLKRLARIDTEAYLAVPSPAMPEQIATTM